METIQFVTLLLGLVVGPRTVELAAPEPVTAIQLFLDGREIGRMESAPWRIEIDFGPDLEPHRLEAVAFDETGAVLGRARQIVNYSRASFEGVIILQPAREGRSRTGRIVWRSALDEPPERIGLRFDGRAIEVDEQAGFELPPHDLDQLHVLEAELAFSSSHSARASLSLGGVYGEEVSATLTAVPVTSPLRTPWTGDEVRGWLTKGGQPLTVFTVGGPPGNLVLLRDQGLLPGEVARRRLGRGSSRSTTESPDLLDYHITAISPHPLESHGGTFRLAGIGRVDREVGLRPVLLRRLPWLSKRDPGGRRLDKRVQKIWDSLAVAGDIAASTNTPRVVLLMLGGRPRDKSSLSPAQSLHYLASIHVPLLVWVSEPQALDRLGLRPGEHVYLGRAGLPQIAAAAAAELASQTIIWVEGEHLPGELALADDAPPSVSFLR